jgi:hypothetical protein
MVAAANVVLIIIRSSGFLRFLKSIKFTLSTSYETNESSSFLFKKEVGVFCFFFFTSVVNSILNVHDDEELSYSVK